MSKPKEKRRKKSDQASMAARADRHDLYQRSVQCVEAEIDFIDETYSALRGKEAVVLREDFCGTANTSCEWIRRRPNNRAVGIDLDASVLEWGRQFNVEPLGSAAKRVELICDDVLTARTERVDALLAMNFSYWLFKDRKSLRNYFQRSRENLQDDGILFLDAYGGYDAFRETKDKNKYKNFTYVWDQARYDPVTGDMQCRIHFRFPDGSRIKDAFTYSWRLWTLPEIRELLVEAGFPSPVVYWQGEDEDGEGDGIFEPTERGEADAAWIAYIVAEKQPRS